MMATLISGAAATTASGNSGAAKIRTGQKVAVQQVTSAVSGTSPTLDIEIEWSNDGTNWSSASTPDTLAQITGTGDELKVFDVKGKFFRAVWTLGGTATPTVTVSCLAHIVE